MAHIGVVDEHATIKARLVVACNNRNQLSISLEIPPTDGCVRMWLIRDLRRKGYRLREIGDLLGLTRQRVYQIERRSLRNIASARRKHSKRTALSRRGVKGISIRRAIGIGEYNRRLDELNARYEKQLRQILEGRYRRPRFHSATARSSPTLFWKAWPCIEQYDFQPFSYTKLISHHSKLAREPMLPQLLCRLRKQRLLKKVGVERTAGHNLPEVVMVQASIEEYVAPMVDKLIARWSAKLIEFQHIYTPTRPILPIDDLRESLMQHLTSRGMTAIEIEDTFARIAPP